MMTSESPSFLWGPSAHECTMCTKPFLLLNSKSLGMRLHLYRYRNEADLVTDPRERNYCNYYPLRLTSCLVSSSWGSSSCNGFLTASRYAVAFCEWRSANLESSVPSFCQLFLTVLQINVQIAQLFRTMDVK